jgi:hypothetical protein
MNKKKLILWIGEHAHSIFQQVEKSVIKKFDNVVILYSREPSAPKINLDPIYFLDEFYPLLENEYKIELLHPAVGGFLGERLKGRDKSLLIGNANELLFQTALNGLELELSRNAGVEDELFELAAFKTFNNHPLFPDMTGQDILFLPDFMPFSDDRQNSRNQREIAKKWFNNVLESTDDMQSLESFLKIYQEDLKKALENSTNVKII